MTTELRETRLIVGSEPPANDALLRGVRLIVGSEYATPDPLIDVRASATAGQASDVTTHPIAVPTGTADGDQLIALFATSTDGPTHTGPAGWTKLGEHSNYGRVTVWQRTAESEPASYDWTTNTADTSAGFILALSNADPESAISAAAGDLDDAPDPVSLTVSDSDDGGWLWLALAAWVDDDATVSAYPSNMDLSTGQIQSGAGTNASAGAGWAATANHETLFDPFPFTLSETEGWMAFTVAVRGLAAAAPGAGGGGSARFGLGLPTLGLT